MNVLSPRSKKIAAKIMGAKLRKKNKIRTKLLIMTDNEIKYLLKHNPTMINSLTPKQLAHSLKVYDGIWINNPLVCSHHNQVSYEKLIDEQLAKENLYYELILNIVPDVNTMERIKERNVHRKKLNLSETQTKCKRNSKYIVNIPKQTTGFKVQNSILKSKGSEILKLRRSNSKLAISDKNKKRLSSFNEREFLFLKNKAKIHSSVLLSKVEVNDISNSSLMKNIYLSKISAQRKIMIAENFLSKEEKEERKIQQSINKLKLLVNSIKIISSHISISNDSDNVSQISGLGIQKENNKDDKEKSVEKSFGKMKPVEISPKTEKIASFCSNELFNITGLSTILLIDKINLICKGNIGGIDSNRSNRININKETEGKFSISLDNDKITVSKSILTKQKTKTMTQLWKIDEITSRNKQKGKHRTTSSLFFKKRLSSTDLTTPKSKCFKSKNTYNPNFNKGSTSTKPFIQMINDKEDYFEDSVISDNESINFKRYYIDEIQHDEDECYHHSDDDTKKKSMYLSETLSNSIDFSCDDLDIN